jgi:hypothetical protein
VSGKCGEGERREKRECAANSASFLPLFSLSLLLLLWELCALFYIVRRTLLDLFILSLWFIQIDEDGRCSELAGELRSGNILSSF